MSWMQTLTETYDACFGHPAFHGKKALPPIHHIQQEIQLEITLDQDGSFVRSAIVEDGRTLVPVTEKSQGRTSGAEPHPLADKLKYIAADYSATAEHQLYLERLQAWNASTDNPKLRAILRYVERGQIVNDLVRDGKLVRDASGNLEKRWTAGLSKLANLLTADSATKERDQGDAMVRWLVSIPGDLEIETWMDEALHQAWTKYIESLPTPVGLCLASGNIEPLASNHPKGLRRPGDSAKLISANDEKGFTYLGRFMSPEEVYGLGWRSTQKAHSALRWLITHQGTHIGEEVVVAWEIHGAPIPPLLASTQQIPPADTWEMFGDPVESQAQTTVAVATSIRPASDDGYRAGEAFARQLRKKLLGYRAQFGPHSDCAIMALDSATKGRLAVAYYRRLPGGELLDRVERWHTELAWPQNHGQGLRYIGAPSPLDIAEVVQGLKLDVQSKHGRKRSLKKPEARKVKLTAERILPMIVDGLPVPLDLVLMATARTIRESSQKRPDRENADFERALGVACSLVRAHQKEKGYGMSLDPNEKNRSYLFGRLLAVAEKIESFALVLAEESRSTTAERMMQRFSDQPAETWVRINESLLPYRDRIRRNRPKKLGYFNKVTDEIMSLFSPADFVSKDPLRPEFLLGYHCQRAALRKKRPGPSTDNS